MLNPYINQTIQNDKKAKIIVLQDKSSSIAMVTPESTMAEYQGDLNQFVNDMESLHPVETYEFGTDVEEKAIDTGYNEKVTDLYRALDYINKIYESDHVGAIVLATDGIYNRGGNPSYFKFRNNTPLLIYGMGDTTQRSDVKIQQVLYNEIVRKDETSEIEVDVKGHNTEAKNISVHLQQWDKGRWSTIESKTIRPESNDFFETVIFQRSYTNPGLDQLRIKLSDIENDIQPANNERNFFVEVLETTRKIAIVSPIPHPDIAALTELLTTENNEVAVYINNNSKTTNLPSPQDADLWIFYQLSTDGNLNSYLQTVIKEKKPIFYINGLKTNDNLVNEVQNLVEFKVKSRQHNLYSSAINPLFDYFTIDDEWKSLFSKFPPLTSKFGEFTLVGNGQNLLTQQIGDVETDAPSLSLGESPNGRIAVLNGEGIWKWKLFEYLENDNNEILSGFFNKVIEYISQQKDDRLFRLQKNKLLFDETENISFTAELYNPALEKISEPDVFFELTDESNNQSTYTFDKINNQYQLSLGQLNPGTYQYSAHTQSAGKEYRENGQFTVADIEYEYYQLEANHNLLAQLAQNNKGKLFYDFDSIKTSIEELNTMQSYLVESNIKNPLIDWKWLAFIVLLLISAEWIIRRYFGSY
ncbi:hypothetical protein GCM10025777_29000 [Membranihabitans marinus]